MRKIAVLVGFAGLAAMALAAVPLAGTAAQIRPCGPGEVKTLVREAGSCLGDYRKRVANEPIAFCTRTRVVCEKAPPGDAPAATDKR